MPTVYKDVEVEVDIDLGDFDTKDLAAELAKRNASSPLGAGDGDESRLRGIVFAAEMAARRMQGLPRELADLFWHVHGVAL